MLAYQLECRPTSNILGGVLEDSSAQIAGLQAGDQIVSYNGQTISNWEELTNAIQSTTEAADLTYIREGENIHRSN